MGIFDFMNGIFISNKPDFLNKRKQMSGSLRISRMGEFASAEDQMRLIKLLKPTVQCYLNYIHCNTRNRQLNVVLKDFIKAGFDFKKISKEANLNMGKVYNFCKNLFLGNKLKYANTSIEIFYTSYNALSNSKNTIFINNTYKNYIKRFPESSNVLKQLSKSQQVYYVSALTYICEWICLFIGLVHMTNFIMNRDDVSYEFIYGDDGSEVRQKRKKDKEPLKEDSFNLEQFESDNYWALRSIVYPCALMADFFINDFEINRVSGILEKAYKGDLSTEDYGYIRSTEAVATVVIIMGTLLGLKLMLPVLRGCLYAIEASKVDISNVFRDNSEYMEVEAEVIKDKIAQTKDPNAKKRLQKILDKTNAWAIRLKKWADFWYKDQKDAAEEAESRAKAEDDKYEDEDETNEEGGSSPEIFI